LAPPAKRGHVQTEQLLLARGGQYARDLLAKALGRRGVVGSAAARHGVHGVAPGLRAQCRPTTAAAMSPYGFNLGVVELLLETWATCPV
jgi:hypothetical protein